MCVDLRFYLYMDLYLMRIFRITFKINYGSHENTRSIWTTVYHHITMANQLSMRNVSGGLLSTSTELEASQQIIVSYTMNELDSNVTK